MRRFMMVVGITLISILDLFAISAKDYDVYGQTVTGYLGTRVRFTIDDSICASLNGGRGINFDTNDDANNDRYLIAPTQVKKTKPGLLIGKFSLISTTTNLSITVNPGKLTNTADANTKYDYELALAYVLERNAGLPNAYQEQVIKYCESGEDTTIDFSNAGGSVIAKDSGIYFRLVTEVSVYGEYVSDVTFTLEVQ